MTNEGSMSPDQRQAMMHSMMEQFFGGMDAAEKKDLCATMMGKMTEGVDMKAMMPGMMMGMMSGDGPGKMKDMKAKMSQGGPEQHMPQMAEMMLGTMMPHCIGMMLPSIDPDKRGEAATAILSAIIDKGTAGLSDQQAQTFRKNLEAALSPAK